MYAMIATRPDIAFAGGVVKRYIANPGKKRWEAKGHNEILESTRDMCTCFGDKEAGVVSYIDADYASDLDKRRSTSGYVFTFTRGVVSWRSRRQDTTILSTPQKLSMLQRQRLARKQYVLLI